jgi:hypothetical protein
MAFLFAPRHSLPGLRHRQLREPNMNNAASLSSFRSALAFLAVAALVLSAPLAAQETAGRIVGTVTDPSGSVIPRAKVTVTNADTSEIRSTLTGDDGTYQVLLLPVGAYRVSGEAPGFHRTEIGTQRLDVNQSLKVDLKMEVGQTSETVLVEANAVSIETVSPTITNTITATQIINAPLNGRNIMDLAATLPGVTPTSNTGTGAGSFSIAGGRPDSITYLLDGGVNNDLLSNGIVFQPNPDEVQEFTVLNSNYNAEYGRNGGGIVSVVTRSGTNMFHGSAFDFLRNGDFNANSFFNNQAGLPIDPLRRNQFGATVGGPVMIPGLIHRSSNKLFFFVGYQGQRQSDLASTSKVGVFTAAEMTGDFSHSNTAHNGPDTKVVNFLLKYPYYQPNPALASQGIIDPSKISPVAQAYMKAGMLPNAASGTLISQGAAVNNSDEITEKVDFAATSSDRFTFTLGEFRNPQITPFSGANVPGFPIVSGSNRYSATIGYTKTITPRMLNDFRFNAQRNNIKQAIPGTTQPTAHALGINQISDDPTGPPIINFQSSSMTAGFSPQGPTNEIDNTYNWSDTLTWTRGRHSLKAGFSYTPFQNNTVYDFYVNGEYYFYGTNSGNYSQNDRADFLMGLPDEYFQAPRAPSNIRTYNLSYFVQDEWRVRSNLTLTLGMRYEFNSPKKDLQGRSFSLIPGQQSSRFPNAPLGMAFPGDPNTPVGSNFPDKNDFAPRFGFAWAPGGNGRTSIRGGFGVFYDILKGEDNLQYNGQEPFFAASDLFFNPLSGNPTSLPANFSDPFATLGQKNPFPSTPPPSTLNWANAGYLPVGGGGVYYVDPHLRTPYIYQFNLSVERELTRNTLLSVAYIGSNSHKLTSLEDFNSMILGTTNRRLNAQPGVAANTFAYADYFANVGQADYNSLAVGLTRRYADSGLGSLEYQVSYTYGRSIDNVSGFRSSSSRVPFYNWGQFHGVSDYDQPQNVSVYAVWNLPFDHLWVKGPARLTKGWELSPAFVYHAGYPQNVRAGLTRNNTKPGPSADGDPNLVQANLVGPIQYLNPQPTQAASTGRVGNFYFDPNAFDRTALVTLYNNNAAVTDPALRTYGTLGRNAFRGPDFDNVNLSFGKETFLFSERARLKIQGDFFNLLNHTQFLNPSTTITSSFFGQISTTAAPRIIQLSAHLFF